MNESVSKSMSEPMKDQNDPKQTTAISGQIEPSGKMTLAEFEERLPEFFATGTGRVSDDPRFQAFLTENPDSAALVRDLEYIAEHARSLFEPAHDVEPSDDVWAKIQSNLKSEPAADAPVKTDRTQPH